MQSTTTTSINTYTPPTSSDVEIDLASYGINFGQALYGGLIVNASGLSRLNLGKRTKAKPAKMDAVSLADYCLQRLAEIRRINELSHTPSAFSCLMSFIGFLASLIYEKEKETDAYTKFIHEYVKEMYCARVVKDTKCSSPRTTGHSKPNTWGEVIYSLIRCGLVHNMNVSGNKNSGQDQIQVVLTHVPLNGTNCRSYKFGSYGKAKLVVEKDDAVILLINVFDLCDAVQKAIIRMFQKSKVRASAKRVLATRPVIQQFS